MSIKPDPDYSGHQERWIIDCRPDGCKGKRLRMKYQGTLEEAEDWQRSLMHRPIETPETT